MKIQETSGTNVSFKGMYNNYLDYHCAFNKKDEQKYITQFCQQLLSNDEKVLINLINYLKDEYSNIVENELDTINYVLSKNDVKQKLISLSNENKISLEKLLDLVNNEKYDNLNYIESIRKNMKQMISINNKNISNNNINE